MAHNVRIRAPGTWTLASVVSPAEFESFDDAQLRSITESGGTWAMATTAVIGGAGFDFECPVTGAWDVTDGIVLTGTDGLLFGAGTPIVTHGLFSLESSSSMTVASGVTTTWQSGSFGTFASGSTLTVAVGAHCTIQFNSGDGFTLNTGSAATVAAGASLHTYGNQVVHSGGDINVDSGGTISCDAGSAITGTVTCSGALSLTGGVTRTSAAVRSGNSATTVQREITITALASGNAAINHAYADVYVIPQTLGANRTLTLLTGVTGTAPPVGHVTRYVRRGPTGAIDAFNLQISDDVGGAIADMLLSKYAWIDIVWTGALFKVNGCSETAAVTVH